MKPKRRKSMNLVAVGAAVVFILVYTVPTIQHAIEVDRCLDKGGRFNYEIEACEVE